MGMGQQPTRGVSKLEAHRIFVDAHRPERSLVGRVGFGFAHLPRGVVGRRGHREHEGGFVVDPTHTGGEPQAHRLRADERKREGKRLLVLVFLRRCILPHLVVLKLERELMVGDSLLEGEAPPEELARGGLGVELLYHRTDEEVILLLSELFADIHRLVLESSLVLFHRRSPSFSVSTWCPGSVIRNMRRTLAVRLRHRTHTRALGILRADLGTENAGGLMVSPALLSSLAELLGLRATFRVVISIPALTVVLSLGSHEEKEPI